MRKVIDLQTKLFVPPITEIKFDLNSRDEIPKLLIGLQHIYATPKLREEVFSILREAIPGNISITTGRPGMGMWQVLVLGTLRLNCNWDYDKVREIANEHRKVRQMMGHEENDFQKQYPLQTIKDNVSHLTPEILDRINTVVVKYAHSVVGKEDEELHGSCDSFVLETDVEYPTDINILFTAVHKIIVLIAMVCDKLGIKEWRQHKHNLKKVKKLFNTARRLNHSTSNDSKKREERERIINGAYEAYLDVIESLIKRVEQTTGIIEELGLGVEIIAELLLIKHYIVHAKRQIDQTRRRVLEGESIPHDEKVFSIFEEHTEWICKGKAGVPYELGLGVCILKDQFGFILHHQVMEKTKDVEIAVSMVTETKKKFNNLKGCSFDKGFYSFENKKKLNDLLDYVVLPKKGKLSQKEKEEEHSEEFIKYRRKHSAVESSINALENHALDRCPDHGLHGFKRYVSLAILARNIQILGHIIQQKELKSLQREQAKKRMVG